MKKLMLAASLCGLMLPALAHKEGKDAKSCETKACCAVLSRGAMLKGKSANPAKSASAKVAVFSVSNMSCEGCSNGLQASLAKEKGVQEAKVDFKAKRATVRFDSKQTDTKKLEAAFERKGFPAKLAKS